MSILNDPKYSFIKEGKFTTEVIHYKTTDEDGREITRRRIKFRPLPKEAPVKSSNTTKKTKSKKSTKSNPNFIPLF